MESNFLKMSYSSWQNPGTCKEQPEDYLSGQQFGSSERTQSRPNMWMAESIGRISITTSSEKIPIQIHPEIFASDEANGAAVFNMKCTNCHCSAGIHAIEEQEHSCHRLPG